ncbi:alpha/beta hydrolase fold-3 domain-containing protein [Xylariomycetidae sp. FL2044]|nr:alpha/beta hydrolase fold-3 domain-containing protein [Xylariomycetidae sp. FL2044]
MTSRSDFPLLSHQPLRFLFQFTYFTYIAVRVPYYALCSLLPFLRPNSTWTSKQTFMTRVTYSLIDIPSRIGITDKLSLEQGKEGTRFQIVAPSESDFYRGPLQSNIKPGDGRDATCGTIAKKFLETGGADFVFSVQYRLSGYGGMNPFPAALQDALSGYLYLLHELHIPAMNIVAVGDSAGGNLATALLRYFHEFGAEASIPTPKCAVLISSWVAPFDYHLDDSPHRGTDFIPASFPIWGAHTYAGDLPNPASNPYITPLGNPFPTPVPIFAHVGTAEILLESITRWAHEMRGISSHTVQIYYEESAVHDTFFSGELLGFEKSAWEVAEQIGHFVGNF